MMAKQPKGADEGKKTKGPGQRNRNTAPVQVKVDLARMAAVIASHDRITQADLLDEPLRRFLVMHYERVQKAIGEELGRLNRTG